jgi:hypothetical protein
MHSACVRAVVIRTLCHRKAARKTSQAGAKKDGRGFKSGSIGWGIAWMIRRHCTIRMF